MCILISIDSSFSSTTTLKCGSMYEHQEEGRFHYKSEGNNDDEEDHIHIQNKVTNPGDNHTVVMIIGGLSAGFVTLL